jgi:hypothetical protein
LCFHLNFCTIFSILCVYNFFTTFFGLCVNSTGAAEAEVVLVALDALVVPLVFANVAAAELNEGIVAAAIA